MYYKTGILKVVKFANYDKQIRLELSRLKYLEKIDTSTNLFKIMILL